ncbi:hypothetical protein [Parvularcula oceani]|uniref:hypothetical protein n=1 Tax=Parvularcula oceani TaxID=1247963 RepID=UPI0004E2807F|nr:hypothetical protein [Parvularcula oceani]
MIRLLLSLALAVGAYFGPWLDLGGEVTGEAFAGVTADCVLTGQFEKEEACLPEGGLLGHLVAVTTALALLSALASFLGALPVIGRIAPVIAILAGLGGILAFVAAGLRGFEPLLWGAFATGGFGFLLVLAGAGRIGGKKTG